MPRPNIFNQQIQPIHVCCLIVFNIIHIIRQNQLTHLLDIQLYQFFFHVLFMHKCIFMQKKVRLSWYLFNLYLIHITGYWIDANIYKQHATNYKTGVYPQILNFLPGSLPP